MVISPGYTIITSNKNIRRAEALKDYEKAAGRPERAGLRQTCDQSLLGR